MRAVFSLLVGLLVLVQVQADYVLEVQAFTYLNNGSRLSNGNCCDLIFATCSRLCDNQFVFCLRSSSTPNDSNPTNCPLGRYQTGVLGGDDFSFATPIASGVPNPLTFSGSMWPGTVRLFIEVEDEDFSIFGVNDHVDDIYVTITISPNSSFSARMGYTGVFGNSQIELSYRVQCTSNFYGRDCATYCVGRDNSTGHYTCGSNGERICLSGWSDPSTDCLTPVSTATLLSSTSFLTPTTSSTVKTALFDTSLTINATVPFSMAVVSSTLIASSIMPLISIATIPGSTATASSTLSASSVAPLTTIATIPPSTEVSISNLDPIFSLPTVISTMMPVLPATSTTSTSLLTDSTNTAFSSAVSTLIAIMSTSVSSSTMTISGVLSSLATLTITSDSTSSMLSTSPILLNTPATTILMEELITASPSSSASSLVSLSTTTASEPAVSETSPSSMPSPAVTTQPIPPVLRSVIVSSSGTTSSLTTIDLLVTPTRGQLSVIPSSTVSSSTLAFVTPTPESATSRTSSIMGSASLSTTPSSLGTSSDTVLTTPPPPPPPVTMPTDSSGGIPSSTIGIAVAVGVIGAMVLGILVLIIILVICVLSGRASSRKDNEETKVYDDALVINTTPNVVYGLTTSGIQTSYDIAVTRFTSDSDGAKSSSNGVYEDINEFSPAESTAL